MDTLKMLWVGHNGTEWDLLDPMSPVTLVAVEGLGMPAFTHQWTKSGARDGQRYGSTSVDANTMTLTVHVGDNYSQPGRRHPRRGDEWRVLDSDFRRSFSAREEGMFVVISNTGGRRSLALRLDAPIAPPPSVNPALIGSATYVLTLIAGDRPYWEGEPIDQEFGTSSDNAPFLVEDTVAPEDTGLYIALDSPLENATIFNPGDVDAYPEWWVTGYADEAHVGVGEEYAILPFSIALGSKVYVNSFDQTIVDESGTSLWPLMGFTDAFFPPISAHSQTPLHVTLIGEDVNARIGLRIVPRYEGPW